MSTIDIRNAEPGKVLCDMHYGLSQLETRIPGFKLLHHCKLSTERGSMFVGALLEESGLDFPSVHNKYLYLLDLDNSGNYKAVYAYDGRQFGIVTFTVTR